MDLNVLQNIEKVIQFKKDNLTFKINSSIIELKNTENSILRLLAIKETTEQDRHIDQSLRWLTEYKKEKDGKIQNLIHRYADQMNIISSLKLGIKREDQRKNAINRIIEKNIAELNKIKSLKEEEDVEELYLTKQFS